MNTLTLNSTKNSPKILFDLKRGVIQLTGKACERDFRSKFETLSRWVELYCRIPNRTTRIDIELEELDEDWKNLIGHLLWYFVNLHENNKTSLNIFWFLDQNHINQARAIEEIERNLKFKIHKLSPILT